MNPPEQNNPTKRWQNAAPYWEKYRTLITQMFAPLTAALIEEAHIGAGHNVLDIGGGSGEPSLTISTVVGPTGSVMFSDPAPAMMEAAKTEASRRGLTNIHFTQCSGDDLPFAKDSFDAVVGRFSAMFFADPYKATRKVLKVVRPGGRVCFGVWGREEANPFLSSIVQVVERFVQDTPDEANAPDPYRFAAPGELAAVLREAEGREVTERPLKFRIQAPISFDQFWQMRTEMSDTLREKVARLAPGELTSVKQAVADATREHFPGGTMNFPAQVLIVSATKP